jgi:hypothetical protein
MFMKTPYIRVKQVIGVLGMLLVVAVAVGVATYLDIERKARAGEALTATLTRLYQDHTMSAVLRRIQEGDVSGAAQRLDMALCDDILEINSKLATVDDQQKSYTQHMFARIAATRPPNVQIAAGGCELWEDQIAAEQILLFAGGNKVGASQGLAARH